MVHSGAVASKICTQLLLFNACYPNYNVAFSLQQL